MKTYPLFSVGQQGRSPNFTAQSRINMLLQVQPDGDKQKLVMFARPGKTLFTSVPGGSPCRGLIVYNDLLYTVVRGILKEINNSGTITDRGTAGTIVTTSGRVDFATDGTVIVLVDGTKGYTYTIASNTLAEITDADFPDGARTVTWLSGYFVVEFGSAFYWSIDGTTWDPLDTQAAESEPDQVVRVFADHGQLCAFGTSTTEFYEVVASEPTFSRIAGATIEFGLAARWSLTKFNDSLACLMKNRMGQVQVMQLKGYTPTPISNPALDYIINNYSTVSDATAFSYMEGGHPILQVNFPTEGKSWFYDASTNVWSAAEYGTEGARDRGEIAANLVNRRLVSDFENGNIYELDSDVYADNGMAFACEVVGRHVSDDMNRIIVDQLVLDVEVGIGNAAVTEPQVMLQISKDNGHTWGAELWKSLGKTGETKKRVQWQRLGIGRDFLFKFRLADAAKKMLVGASLRVESTET
jgi:hypothetical protein